MSTPEVKISFCTSCRNRLWQIEKTLEHNLSYLEDDSEIVLVDYGSTDGLSKWIWNNFKQFIDQGKLVFFEVTNEVQWSSPKAKNLAHRLAGGHYLFNLDADNFISANDIRFIRKALALDLPAHQWSGSRGDGSYGRIGIPRDIFFRLGGYDETLLPMGGQDLDLIRRLHASNVNIARIPAPEFTAVQNDMAHKLAELNQTPKEPQAVYKLMNELNLKSTELRLELQGPIRKDGFASYKGRLNGRAVMIDGFNNLTKSVTAQ